MKENHWDGNHNDNIDLKILIEKGFKSTGNCFVLHSHS